MKCYRVWFMDGSAMLVDAESSHLAIREAERLAAKQDFKRSYSSRTARWCECLDEAEVPK
jgi:hypothetical protein